MAAEGKRVVTIRGSEEILGEERGRQRQRHRAMEVCGLDALMAAASIAYSKTSVQERVGTITMAPCSTNG